MVNLDSNASAASTYLHLYLWSWLGDNKHSGVPLATIIYSDLYCRSSPWCDTVNEALALFAAKAATMTKIATTKKTTSCVNNSASTVSALCSAS